MSIVWPVYNVEIPINAEVIFTLWKSSKATPATAPLIREAIALHASPIKSGTLKSLATSLGSSLFGISKCLYGKQKCWNDKWNDKNQVCIFELQLKYWDLTFFTSMIFYFFICILQWNMNLDLCNVHTAFNTTYYLFLFKNSNSWSISHNVSTCPLSRRVYNVTCTVLLHMTL